jgi:hypothetical protein
LLQLKIQLASAIFSISLNVLLAVMLVGRLLWLGRKYRRAFGESSKLYTYVSPAAMIIESAALYTVPLFIQSLMFLLSEASQVNEISTGLVDVTAVSARDIIMSGSTYHIHQAIAPLLISYRALKGRLLTTETIQDLEERMTTIIMQDLETLHCGGLG